VKGAAVRTLPPTVRERIAREFSSQEREQAEYVLRGYHPQYTGMPAWKFDEALDRAAGDLQALRSAVGPAGDYRDELVADASRRVLRRLVESRGEGPVEDRVLGAEVEVIRRGYRRNRDRALRFFPADRIDDVLLSMGPSWPSNAEEIFTVSGGDADRLLAMLEGREAAEADPSIPAPLARLPFMAALLIRRDFAPEAWEGAARVAAVAPRVRGVGGALMWLLLAEYAAGDPKDLEWAVRMQDGDYDALSAGVARRRAARREPLGS
jgi:hypothetical protein